MGRTSWRSRLRAKLGTRTKARARARARATTNARARDNSLVKQQDGPLCNRMAHCVTGIQ